MRSLALHEDSCQVMVHLICACKQKVKLSKPVVKALCQWINKGVKILQACLDCAYYEASRTATENLNNYVDAATSCFSFCKDNYTITYHYNYNNDKLSTVKEAKVVKGVRSIV